MPTIIMIEHNGSRYPVQARTGESVMQAVVNQMVPGLLADCGGTGSCGTCHSYVAAPWQALLPAPDANEQLMLEGVLEPRANSRLTCQILVTDALEGLQLELPASQC